MKKDKKKWKGLLSGEKHTPEELAELEKRSSPDDILRYWELTKDARAADTRWRKTQTPDDGKYH